MFKVEKNYVLVYTVKGYIVRPFTALSKYH